MLDCWLWDMVDRGSMERVGTDPAERKAKWKRIVPALAADGVEWLVVKPTMHPGSLDDLKSSIKYLKGIMK